MSKIGKKPIELPENVKVEIKDRKIKVEGKKGVLEKEFLTEISVEKKEKELLVKFVGPRDKKALWGTWRQLINNMVEGVTKGFEKKLQIEGIGYRASLQGKDLILNVGFTHPVKISPPEGITFSVDKNIITVSGIDKEKVGNVAAMVRRVKPPEPYKGKGIRYVGEVIRRKAGKKAVQAGE